MMNLSTTPAPSNPTATPDPMKDLRATATPTALSALLRGLRCFGPEHFSLLEQAADEIERYHGGMLAALSAMQAAAIQPDISRIARFNRAAIAGWPSFDDGTQFLLLADVQALMAQSQVKCPAPQRAESLPSGGLEPDWNGYAMDEKKDAAQGDAKHLVDAVTAVMSKHGLIDHLTLGATERFCDELLATFKAAEKWAVLPSHDLAAISHRHADQWRSMTPELRDAITKLVMNDAVAYASLHIGMVQGLSETDTLAHIVLNLASSKGKLQDELYQLAALSPPGKAAL